MDVLARHGLRGAEIDQHRKAAAAAGQRAAQVGGVDDRLGRGDRAHDGVGPHQFLRQAVEARGSRSDFRGNRVRARPRAIRHDELSDAERSQVPRHLQAGLTRTNHDHARSRQRQGRDNWCTAADATDSAPTPMPVSARTSRPVRSAACTTPVQHRSRAAARIERGPHLTEDLGLTDHQGFEARADPEQMPRGGAARQPVHAVVGVARRHAHGLGECGRHDARVLGRAFAPVHLCAVARGQHERLDVGAGQFVMQRHGRIAGQAPLLQGAGPDGAVIQGQGVQPAERPRRAGRARASAGCGHVGREAAGTISHGLRTASSVPRPAWPDNSGSDGAPSGRYGYAPLRSGRGVDNAFPDGHLDQHGHRLHAELVHQVRTVGLDGADADVQLAGDLLGSTGRAPARSAPRARGRSASGCGRGWPRLRTSPATALGSTG